MPGSYFHLELLGYKYADAEGEPYDANWLLVRVDAVGPQGAWSVTDPCLLTYEATSLVEWLAAVGSDAMAAPAISFLEPGLLFRQVEREGGEKFLRIHFGSLVHPGWASIPLAPGVNPDLWLDFPLAEIDLSAAATALKKQVERYPRRYER
ncbi:MAG: hypothetical protein IH586_14430 [Anaerolineaceae bacterium]|nr:hypothetical protein [Anaerolineaceae bacterium]